MTAHRTSPVSDSFDCFTEGRSFAIRYIPSYDLTIGYHRRAGHALRLVKSALAKVRECKIKILDNALTATAADFYKSDLLNAVDLAKQRLQQFGEEKITAKAVETILGITAMERQRWTKDGRIRHSGAEFFQRGSSKIRIPTYSREVILDVYAQAALIDDWRNTDVGNQ